MSQEPLIKVQCATLKCSPVFSTKFMYACDVERWLNLLTIILKAFHKNRKVTSGNLQCETTYNWVIFLVSGNLFCELLVSRKILT